MLLTDENRSYYQEKLFSYGVAGLICLVFSPENVGIAYIMLGFAHYSMTALYQFKAGRITPRKLAMAALLAVALFTVAHFFPKHFTVFAAGFLLLHVFSGEIRHFNRAYTFPYFMLTACLAVLLCAWLAIELWYGIPIHIPSLIAVLTLLVGWATYRYFREVDLRRMDAFFPTLLAFYTVFVAMEFFGMRPTAFEAFGFITIAHFMTTYFNVFKRFRGKATRKAKIFAIESVAVNLLTFSGFFVAVFLLGQNSILYEYFYHPISFYVWTIMHFLTTWNNDDYEYIFQDPGPDGKAGPEIQAKTA